MGPNAVKTVIVNVDINSTLEYARQAIFQCGWKLVKIESYNIFAQTGITWRSWGEKIIIRICVTNNQTYLRISSEFVTPAIADLCNFNKKNIKKFISTFEQLISMK